MCDLLVNQPTQRTGWLITHLGGHSLHLGCPSILKILSLYKRVCEREKGNSDLCLCTQTEPYLSVLGDWQLFL